MTALTNDFEKLANEVLSTYKITKSPFREISKVFKGENIRVRPANLSQGVDGLFANIDEQKLIFYNSNKPSQRSVFTKAHELGHYFLKHTLDEQKLICSNVGGNSKSNKQEWQADQFAVYFLMPKELMVEHFITACSLTNRSYRQPLYVDKQPWNYKDWKVFCWYFRSELGISSEALRYRLENLGLLNWNLK
jgi:Zn-dependent peptidase ImmA (M78 family)